MRGALSAISQKAGDPDTILGAIDRTLAGPVHLGQSAGISRRGNFEPAIDPPRGFNARERRAAALPGDGKNLTEISATFSTGYKTAANIVPAAKLKLYPDLTLVEFPIE